MGLLQDKSRFPLLTHFVHYIFSLNCSGLWPVHFNSAIQACALYFEDYLENYRRLMCVCGQLSVNVRQAIEWYSSESSLYHMEGNWAILSSTAVLQWKLCISGFTATSLFAWLPGLSDITCSTCDITRMVPLAWTLRWSLQNPYIFWNQHFKCSLMLTKSYSVIEKAIIFFLSYGLASDYGSGHPLQGAMQFSSFSSGWSRRHFGCHIMSTKNSQGFPMAFWKDCRLPVSSGGMLLSSRTGGPPGGPLLYTLPPIFGRL